MLHFPCSLTPAATDILVYGLEISADLARDMSGDEWAMAYPLSAKCLTPQRAHEALLDLLEKLRQSQEYVPTTYHWLLIYECLHLHIECLNDDLWPDLVQHLKTSRDARDTPYLSFSPEVQGQEGLHIDFERFIEMYFWDTDFLLDPSTYYQLGATSKQQLGYPADLFSVLTGLPPHPTELVLKRVEEFEPTEPEREGANGER